MQLGGEDLQLGEGIHYGPSGNGCAEEIGQDDAALGYAVFPQHIHRLQHSVARGHDGVHE